MKTEILGYMYLAGWLLKILLWGWLAGIYFNIAQGYRYGFDDFTDEVDDAFTAIGTAFLSSIGRPILLFILLLRLAIAMADIDTDSRIFDKKSKDLCLLFWPARFLQAAFLFFQPPLSI